jgi:hypothetical protein
MSQSHESPRQANGWATTGVGPLVVAVVLANIAFDIGLFIVRSRIDAALDPGDVWGTPSRANYQLWTACSEAFLLGLLYAQLVMIAIWTALFPGNSVRRLLVGTLAVIVFGVVILMIVQGTSADGYYLRNRFVELDRWQLLGDALWMVAWGWTLFYLAQAPFWIMRRAVHMRIVHRTADDLSTRNAPLRLLDIFGVLAFVAVPLALLRVISPDGLNPSLGLAMVALVAGMWFFGVCYLEAVFGAKSAWRAIIAVLLVSELAALAGAFVFPWVERRAGPIPNVLVTSAFHAMAAAVMLVALGNGLWARAAGYRLVARWPRPRSVDAPRQAAITASALPESTARP